uniref:Uncharacterized protein n=1 Tax=Zea mays TaxID=4577 RepID=A0A804R9U7_MAIZE
MTSASELFIARRAARGARLSDPDPDPDPHPVALRDQHGLGGRRQRRGCRPRRQLDAAGDVRQHLHTGAPPPRRRGSYTALDYHVAQRVKRQTSLVHYSSSDRAWHHVVLTALCDCSSSASENFVDDAGSDLILHRQ